MSKFGENLETDTGSYGQSAGTQKYQVQGKRVRWAAPFLLRLPGIIEVTAATSVEQPEFLVKEQRVWKDRVVPGPVEVSPLNPIRTNSINIENQEAAAFETYPKLPVAPYARQSFIREPVTRIRETVVREPVVREIVRDAYTTKLVDQEVGPAFVRETFDFKDLQRAFERRGPRGRVNFFDFQDIINARTNRVSTSRLKKAFDRMKIPNSDVIFFDEFLNVVGRKTAISRSDDIERYIYDAVLDLNL